MESSRGWVSIRWLDVQMLGVRQIRMASDSVSKILWQGAVNELIKMGAEAIALGEHRAMYHALNECTISKLRV